MKVFATVFHLLLVMLAGTSTAQQTSHQPDSLVFSYTEQRVEDAFHFFLEGPATYKFVSRHKVKNPKMTKDFDFLEGDLQLKYLQRKAAFIVKASGDTLASIIFQQDWFDIVMPDGRLYKFGRIGKHQWEYSLNGKKVFDATLTETGGKKEVSWKLTESEPDAALALSNVGAAFSWNAAVHTGLSSTAVVMAVVVGVILALLRT